MDEQAAHRLETDVLIEAIWGPQPPDHARRSPAAEERMRQNEALASALRAYLQQYLIDAAADVARD